MLPLAQPQKLKRNLIIILILLLAFAFRVMSLNEIPAGLSHDEAYNGVTAIQVLEGQYRVFFEINKGIEPLIIYLEALAFYAFGISIVALRLVNVFTGILTIALVYPFTVRLSNRRIALLAVTGVSISFWAVFVSRLTLRAVLLPPLLLLTIYFFWRGLSFQDRMSAKNDLTIRAELPLFNNLSAPFSSIFRPLFAIFNPQYGYFALSGLFSGITMYTYLSSRFVPLIILAIFGYYFIHRKIRNSHWIGLSLYFFVFILIFSPLALYFLQNYESFTHRSAQVTTIPHALNGDFVPMIRNTYRTLGMFTFQGDTTDRYNLDSRPIFDQINGILFYLGILLAIWRILRSSSKAPEMVLLVTTALFMLIPDFITDDSPHFLRTIGAMPIVYIFWALGLDSIISQLNRWRITTNLRSGAALHLFLCVGLLVLTIVFPAFQTGYDYFKRWAIDPDARYIYGADIAEIARHLKRSQNQGLPVISAEYYRDLDQFRFQIHFNGQPPFAIWFDGQQALAFPPPDSNLSPRYIFPDSAPPSNIWINLIKRSPDESGQEYDLYRLSDNGSLEQYYHQLTPIGVNINNDLILLGYQLIGNLTRGDKFQILLNWQALRTLPPGTDYTFSIQLRDHQGQLVVEVDGNGYDPGDWQPGVIGLQLLPLRLPRDLPPDVYHLALQIIDRQTGQALPALNKGPLIDLGPIEIKFDP